MANKKVTALTENTSPASEDLLYSVDDPSGTPASRKITVQNLLQVIPTRTVNTTPATDDYVVIIDDPAGSATVQHITIEDLLKGILTSTGDIMYRNSGGTITRLAIGSPTNVLAVNGAGDAVQWSAAASGGGGAASMLNNYGGTIPEASIVVFDNSATAAVTMGSIYMDGRVVGVASADINAGGTGSIYVGEQVVNVLTYGTVSIGDWIVHGTIEGQGVSYGPTKPVYNHLGVSLSSLTAAGTTSMLMVTDPMRQTASAGNSYILGGYGAGASQAVQRLAEASDTWSNKGNKLPRTTYYNGVYDYNDTTVYQAGGFNALTQFSKYTIASDTGSDTGATLNGGRNTCAALQDDAQCAFMGGASTWDRRDGFTFSTETRYWADFGLSPTNSVASYGGGCYNKNTGIGYSGGKDGYATTIYKITFPTTQTTVSALSVAKAYVAQFLDDHASPVNGYFAGGHNGSNVTSVDKFPFSTETVAATTAMPSARNNVGGISTYTAGFHTNEVATDKMAFSTDTWSNFTTNPVGVYASGGAGPFSS